jgi:peroxiredoxin Q/BCP
MKRIKIQEGDTIPSFKALDHEGKQRVFTAEGLVGPTVFYFYPKDDTPGCTKEACSFRDAFADFTDAGVEVYGISADDVESHRKFREKHRLPFVLLSDPDNSIRNAFGVPRDLFGMLPGRVTYVTDARGKVLKIFNSQLNATKHVEEALNAVRTLAE